MPFVIRTEGFMYNDEYNAPIGHRLVLVRRAYETREQAEDVLERLHREWIRSSPEVLEEHLAWEAGAEVHRQVTALLRQSGDEIDEAWGIPLDATDDQLDELIRVARLQLGEVCEVEDAAEALSEAAEPREFDDVWYGDPRLFAALRKYDPAPWPPAVPTPAQLGETDEKLQVAWDWVASQPAPAPAPRDEARRRARVLRLDWHEPVHRALVSYAADLDRLTALIQ